MQLHIMYMTPPKGFEHEPDHTQHDTRAGSFQGDLDHNPNPNKVESIMEKADLALVCGVISLSKAPVVAQEDVDKEGPLPGLPVRRSMPAASEQGQGQRTYTSRAEALEALKAQMAALRLPSARAHPSSIMMRDSIRVGFGFDPWKSCILDSFAGPACVSDLMSICCSVNAGILNLHIFGKMRS